MAKVTIEITADGKLETEIDDHNVLSSLFRLGEHLSPGVFLCVPKKHEHNIPHRYRDLSDLLRIPGHMDHFDWKVRSLIITDNGKHSVVYHQVLMTQEEYHLLLTSFGHCGCCACDGATSDGCPLCDDEKTRKWK